MNELVNKFISESLDEFPKCNVCGSDEKEEINSMNEFETPVKNVICKKCGLIYMCPRLSKKSYKTFYEKYYQDAEELRTPKEVLIQRQIELGKRIKERTGKYANLKDKKILDIGCGYGYCLLPFKEAGCYTKGVEINSDIIKDTKEKFNLSSQEIDDIDEKFDLIIASNIIEHLNNPREEIEKMKKLLNKDGLIYFTQTGLFMLPYYFGHELSNFIKVEHPYNFSFTTFKNLLGVSGLEVLEGDETIYSIAKVSEREFQLTPFYKETIEFLEKCKKKKFKKLRRKIYISLITLSKKIPKRYLEYFINHKIKKVHKIKEND